MSTEVVMPQMGESIAEGTITKWLKKVGERVERHQLGGEQFVIGEEMQQLAALKFVFKAMQAGEFRLAAAMRFETQKRRSSRRCWSGIPSSRLHQRETDHWR